MKKSRFSEEQIVAILKESEAGVPNKELCRKHGIADGTFYQWRSKYGGMQASDVKRLKSLEEENLQLKRLVGQQALDIDGFKNALSKKY
jgi:putative transposase